MDKYNLDQLVREVAAGDKDAYRKLLDVSAKLIRGYLAVQMAAGTKGDLEDIVQETLLAVHLKYHTYNPDLPYLPWLRTIAHHKLIDHWRRSKIARTINLDDNLIENLPAQETANDASLTVDRLLSQLPEKQQRIVRLARLDGKSMAEIANEMSLSVSDVKVTLHRAIQKLARAIKDDEMETGHAHG